MRTPTPLEAQDDATEEPLLTAPMLFLPAGGDLPWFARPPDRGVDRLHAVPSGA